MSIVKSSPELHTPTWHARLSMSGMERWVECAGSVEASKNYPRTESVHSIAGTLGHHYGAHWLKTGIRPVMAGLDKEHRGAVVAYVTEIFSRTQGAELIVEETLPAIIEIHEDAGGTPDCLALHTAIRQLEVIDYKSGKARVSPKALQLIGYAIGALFEHNYVEWETVKLTIIQPRAGGEIARSVVMTIKELKAYIPKLREAAKRTRLIDPPFKAGKWCWYCPHKPDCAPRKQQLKAEKDSKAGNEFENE